MASLKRESSLEMDDFNQVSSGTLPEDPGFSGDGEDEGDLNLPPGRLHSTSRIKEKLSGSSGNLNVPPGSFHSTGSVTKQRKPHQHDGTRSPGSRSRSPSLGKDRSTLTTAIMGDSSISSLEDLVDNDILYDRQGLIDDLSQSSSKGVAPPRNFTNLPPVNERLSEETLDDCHAFADLVVRSSNASRTASVGTDRELFLDPLDEIDEEGDDASLEDPSESENQQIILTNLEKITISQPSIEEASASAFARGSSSIMDGEGESAAPMPNA